MRFTQADGNKHRRLVQPLVISVCLLLCLSISCQPKVQEMPDVERIEIEEIKNSFFWNVNRAEIKVLKSKMKYVL